jgi:hypothetical protein
VAKAVPDHLEAHTQLAVAYARLGRAEDTARERETVRRLTADREQRFFSGVSESLARLLGKKSDESPATGDARP